MISFDQCRKRTAEARALRGTFARRRGGINDISHCHRQNPLGWPGWATDFDFGELELEPEPELEPSPSPGYRLTPRSARGNVFPGPCASSMEQCVKPLRSIAQQHRASHRAVRRNHPSGRSQGVTDARGNPVHVLGHQLR